MRRRFFALALVATLFALAATGGAQQPAGSANQRVIHPVKYGNAKDLADLLGRHFKAGETLQILADPSTNSLLINAPPALVKEILEHTKQLDRQPRQVALDVILVEVHGKKNEEGKPAPLGKEFDPRAFQGPAEAVLQKVAEFKKKGLVNDVKHFEMKATENQPANVKDSSNKPFVSGVSVNPLKGGGPQVSRQVSYRNVGTIIDAKIRMPDGKSLLVDLKIEDSRIHTPEDGISLGQDDAGKPVFAAEFITTSTTTRLNLTPGDAAAIEGIKTESRGGQVQMLIIVAARLVEEGK